MVQARPAFATALHRYKEELGSSYYDSMRVVVSATALDEMSIEETIDVGIRSANLANLPNKGGMG